MSSMKERRARLKEVGERCIALAAKLDRGSGDSVDVYTFHRLDALYDHELTVYGRLAARMRYDLDETPCGRLDAKDGIEYRKLLEAHLKRLRA